MKKLLFLLILLVASCGYHPIYLGTDEQKFRFSKVIIEENDEISKKIINSISFEEIETDESLDELVLKSSYEILETSKNSKGQVQSYRSKIFVTLKIVNNNKKIKEKKFLKEFSYNTKNNKFALIQYQKEIQNNLVKEIVRDINIYLNI